MAVVFVVACIVSMPIWMPALMVGMAYCLGAVIGVLGAFARLLR